MPYEKQKQLKYQRTWYKKNKKKQRAYKRNIYWKNQEAESLRKKKYFIENRDKILARQKKWRNENKDKLKKYFTLYRTNPFNLKKANARSYLWLAVKQGKLLKSPCFCGNPKVKGHHENYDKPLEVIWLCRKHHIEADKKLKSNEN